MSTVFEETIKTLIKEQGVSEMALTVTEHPIAGHNLEAIRKKAEKDFPAVLKAATQWSALKK